jgi:hypothetical protein
MDSGSSPRSSRPCAALEALGNKGADRTVDFYLKYLKACRDLAKAHRVSLRKLDRALWQWSSEHAKQVAIRT